MKLIHLASLALIAPLMLSGCASSLSPKDQAKIVEYENCLIWEMKRVELFATAAISKADYAPEKIRVGDAIQKSLQETDFGAVLKPCEKFRP